MQVRGRFGMVAVLALATTTFVGCGGTSDTEAVAAIQQVVRSAAEASTAGDVGRFAFSFTDQDLMEEYEMTRTDFLQMNSEEFAFPVTVEEFGDARIDGDAATVEVVFSLNDSWLDGSTLHLVKADGLWKIDRRLETEDFAVALRGVTPIDIELTEFAYIFDPADLTGPVVQAFTIENAGAQEHEAVLVRLDLDGTLPEIVDVILAEEGDEPPPGIEFIAAAHAAPGASTALAFKEPLAPGRYAFLCFFEDASDPGHIHVEKGMAAEFTVGG